MSASLREKAFWACAEGEETEVRRQVPIVDALVARAETQVQRIVGSSDPCQVMLVQLAPEATAVEPLGTVVVQVDDVALVFNRAYGPYGYQPGQVYLAQQDDERWQLVGDPIEDLADLGRELKATGVNNAGPLNVPRLIETEAESGTRCLGLMRHMSPSQGSRYELEPGSRRGAAAHRWHH